MKLVGVFCAVVAICLSAGAMAQDRDRDNRDRDRDRDRDSRRDGRSDDDIRRWRETAASALEGYWKSDQGFYVFYDLERIGWDSPTSEALISFKFDRKTSVELKDFGEHRGHWRRGHGDNRNPNNNNNNPDRVTVRCQGRGLYDPDTTLLFATEVCPTPVDRFNAVANLMLNLGERWNADGMTGKRSSGLVFEDRGSVRILEPNQRDRFRAPRFSERDETLRRIKQEDVPEDNRRRPGGNGPGNNNGNGNGNNNGGPRPRPQP